MLYKYVDIEAFYLHSLKLGIKLRFQSHYTSITQVNNAQHHRQYINERIFKTSKYLSKI